MALKTELNGRISRWALLNHPFYQAWESGKLPVEALKTYAHEYGAFNRLLPDGWQTLQDSETAEEERQHAALWQDFAMGLGTEIGEPKLPAVAALVDNAIKLFARPETAMGALYAFEAQQPATAKSKLDGLRKHYQLPASVEPYFEAHANNQHEAAKLLSRMDGLSPKQQTEALSACEQMSEALWNALTDIYDTHCKM